MKLSEIEKKEMLEDGKNKKRMLDFKKVKYYGRKMSFEEYISWLGQIQKIHPVKQERKFVVYKNVKI